MKMYNFELENFGKFLMDLSFKSGKVSRMRSRLVKLLDKQLETIQKERAELLVRLSEKDDEGNAKYSIINESIGQVEYIISDENKIILQTEMKELWNEEFIIDETEGNRDMLISVRDAILDYVGELSGTQAILYDRFCEIIENVYI